MAVQWNVGTLSIGAVNPSGFTAYGTEVLLKNLSSTSVVFVSHQDVSVDQVGYPVVPGETFRFPVSGSQNVFLKVRSGGADVAVARFVEV